LEHVYIACVVLRYKCDGCQGLIVGTRVHCDVCDDFDLCLCCQSSQHYPARSVVTSVPLPMLFSHRGHARGLFSIEHITPFAMESLYFRL